MDVERRGFSTRGLITAATLAVLLLGGLFLLAPRGDDATATPAAGRDAARPTSAVATTTPLPSTPASTTPATTVAAGTSPDAALQPDLTATPAHAQANARDVSELVEACFARTPNYTLCTTRERIGSARVPVVASSPRAGEVSIVAVARTFVISAADSQGQLWRIAKKLNGDLQRTCHEPDGVASCPGRTTW